ncbi:MAG: HAMP domain-containing histidine kinase [Firmicutes bacterium]|nr:HAMP domain-containing histidine kinase [Bacillota bacterium]
MRLFAKFFLCATTVISIALLVSGYLLITFSHESAVKRELERAATQFQFDKFAVQVRLLSIAADGEIPGGVLSAWASDLSGFAAFFAYDRTLLYSNLPGETGLALLENVSDTAHAYRFQTLGEDSYIVLAGRLTQNNITLYLVVATDITAVGALREQMTQSFVQVYFITLISGMVVIMVLSAFITGPIKKMSKLAAQIARGNYNERLPVVSRDEIGALSNSFNLMADSIEGKIYELLENARQKEDFVANFAHELKTPLTSVIGYADMLYQKDLTPGQTKDAAWYILNEGLRLEALSLKLMDLIVLNRQDFVLENISTEELLTDLSGSLMPVLEENNITLKINAAPEYILVEYDLFKTLMLNLIDNAIKAGCSTVEITGKQVSGRYEITVIDNGRGMPEAELARITEAFYVVDKSRSRRQHGAGIGLALAAKIAAIHGSTLQFDSIKGSGTMVKTNLAISAYTEDI